MSTVIDQQIPNHIAIIMDGNNRWAKMHNLPHLSGHKEGVEAVRNVIEVCRQQSIPQLTLFVFSSENWKRPRKEVQGLMDLFLHSLKHYAKTVHKYDVKLRIFGERTRLKTSIQLAIKKAENRTKHCKGMTLNLAINYGGQWDILQACQKLLDRINRNTLVTSQITQELIQSELVTHSLPPVELMIRTGGEQRISNFLLWHCCQAYLYFTSSLWPDFSEDDILAAIADWGNHKNKLKQYTIDQSEIKQKTVLPKS